ncbi:MAG: NADH-quinone oxidoreductase subunit C [Candidatus Margulisiibacteriota bacterium]|jgi:NADH-quinone oxidoreductase subunit C
MKIGEKIKSVFNLELEEKAEGRFYVTTGRDRLRDLVGHIYTELGGRLSTISAIDQRFGIELIYHLAINQAGVFISVRVMVEKPDLAIGSMIDIIPAADWIEREIHEMFGVFFVGHPKLEKLLLPDDWPSGEYPLRKKTFESENELPGAGNG